MRFRSIADGQFVYGFARATPPETCSLWMFRFFDHHVAWALSDPEHPVFTGLANLQLLD
jgi:hypothetical protein